MAIEQVEVTDFFQRHKPFSDLAVQELSQLASGVEIAYYKAGSPILTFGQDNDQWFVIRSGAVEVFRRDGELYNRLGEGNFFGELAIMRNRPVRFPVVALEDTLAYLIDADTFNHLFDNNEQFADFVEVEDRSRLRDSNADKKDNNSLLTAKVEKLIGQLPLILPPNTTVQEAAVRMTEEGVSSVLISNDQVSSDADTDDEELVIGIVTDVDIRSRLVAQGLDLSSPVTDIMTSQLTSVQSHQYVFEAMMLMLKHKVMHEDANSQMIGSAMAVIGRSFKQRLLELAEQELGPPPVPYCFLALGSMARDEQLIVTDQDNALVLDNRFDPQLHDEYFNALANFVCDGLDRCGYTYCNGGIMATNKKWRQPLKVWEQYFSQWIEKPTAETLLNSAIFFDLDGVWGKKVWADTLNRLIRKKAYKNARFLACMARNALLRTPPLGFFKDFVMETDGRQTNSINMKRRGTAPIADLIRVHALSIGAKGRNSFARLQDVIESKILPPGRGVDLRDALEFIAMVRIRHQAFDLDMQRVPDNDIEPEYLSDFERKNLKDAFQILSDAQKFMKYRYQPGRHL